MLKTNNKVKAQNPLNATGIYSMKNTLGNIIKQDKQNCASYVMQ